MVVVVEAGMLELADVVVGQHAERHARLHAHRLDAFDHGDQHVHVARLWRAPRRAHAIASRALLLGLARLRQHLLDLHELAGLEARGVVGRLAAVSAVLGAAACLDRQQAAHLHGVGIEIAPVDRVRLEDEVVERGLVERQSLVAGPVVAH